MQTAIGRGVCALLAASAWVSDALAVDSRQLIVLESLGPGTYAPATISSDGRIVTGLVYSQYQGTRFVRWTDREAQTLFHTFAVSPSLNGMTPDGRVVVGHMQGGYQHEAFSWSAAGLVRLGFLQATSYYWSDAKDVSADGRRVVGYSSDWPRQTPVSWTDGIIAPLENPFTNGDARLITDDGHRIVGVAQDAAGTRLAVWDYGVFHDAGSPPGVVADVDPRKMLADGSRVVGTADFGDGRRAFVWDGTAFHALGQLPDGDLTSTATGVSSGGAVVVGYAMQRAGSYCQGDCDDVRTPFLWTPQTGMRPLREYLQYACGYDVHRWEVAPYSDPVVSESGGFVAFGSRDPNGELVMAAAEIGDSCDPEYAVPLDPIGAGDLLVASFDNASVVRADAETGAQEFVTQGGYLLHPRYLAQAPDGELLVLDSGRIIGVDVRTGAQRLIAWLQSSPATFAVDPDGRLFISEWLYTPYPGKARIIEIDRRTGEMHPVYEGPGLGQGGGPLLAGRDGRLYYRGDFGGTEAILQIDLATSEQRVIAIGDLSENNSMAITPDGRLVFLDYAGIHAIDTTTGARSTVVPDIASASLPFLIGFATSIDARGRLLVADPYLYFLSAADVNTGRIDVRSAHLLLNAPLHAIELRAACNDGFDNDGDGRFDHPADPGCAASDGASELNVDLSLRIAIVRFESDLIAVTVLGAADFDVRSLDPGSIAFGPGAAAPIVHGEGPRVDTNRDGHLDWKLFFRSSKAEIPPDATEVCLRAETDDGIPAYGCATIQVSACGMGFEIVFALLPLRWVRVARRRPN